LKLAHPLASHMWSGLHPKHKREAHYARVAHNRKNIENGKRPKTSAGAG
jgi:hypothetical protein